MHLEGTWTWRARARISRTALLAIVGVGLTRCAWQDEARYRARLENTGKPALHAVHGERLRTLMLRMSALMFERQRTQVEIDADRERYAEQTAQTAAALLETVGYIEAAEDDLGLSAEERRVFDGLRVKLKNQLVKLRDSAQRREVDALPPAVRRHRAHLQRLSLDVPRPGGGRRMKRSTAAS